MSPVGGPNELPAPEIGEGGSRIPSRPGGIGGPAELPPATVFRVNELVAEILSLRDRVHGLESQFVASRLNFGRPPIHELPRFSAASRFVGGPQELPEGGEGGGGFGVFHPPHEIAELPVFNSARLLQEITLTNQRLTSLEGLVTQLSKSLATQAKK
jgi:hypothetical protein